jgi:hypothetical protein
MKIFASLIIFGLLLTYVPSISMDDCKETEHFKFPNKINLECGNIFHCAFILEFGIPGKLYLPLKGRIVLFNQLINLKLIPRSIFRPPEIFDIKT